MSEARQKPKGRNVKMPSIPKHWHHDIKYIDGEFVEKVVERFQETGDDVLIQKIIENYAIYRSKWGQDFAIFCDGDEEDGEMVHDAIVWKSAANFDLKKGIKPDGKAFNAYLVSALLNQMKNFRNSRTSHKNHPRIRCPICDEEVYQIDDNHLRHRYDLDRYRKDFVNYPLSSFDGNTQSPLTGEQVPRVGLSYMNRKSGYYSVADFWDEFPQFRPRGPYRCPATGRLVSRFTREYFESISPGYTREMFMAEHPSFPGIIDCPFSGQKVLNMSQEWLDAVLEQDPLCPRHTWADFNRRYPNFTTQARQVPVYDPYLGEMVQEITPQMLASYGTSVPEHLQKFATIFVDYHYRKSVRNPFTGDKSQTIKSCDLEQMGKSTTEFYHATCKYPLKRFHVKCAICGQWAENIWSHLEEVEHNYAPHTHLDNFFSNYGVGSTKRVVSNNSYVENDSGETVHIGDLFPKKIQEMDVLEVQDSLMAVARDDLDLAIARAVGEAHSVDDIFFLATKKTDAKLPFDYSSGMMREARRSIRQQLGIKDFDILPDVGKSPSCVTVMVPGKQTLRKRIKRLVKESDLNP
jgi:hypothetical protein